MENTMKKYTSTMMPMAARSFFINVKQDEKGCFYGTINEIFYQCKTGRKRLFLRDNQ